jgi:hypothetical protein
MDRTVFLGSAQILSQGFPSTFFAMGFPPIAFMNNGAGFRFYSRPYLSNYLYLLPHVLIIKANN